MDLSLFHFPSFSDLYSHIFPHNTKLVKIAFKHKFNGNDAKYSTFKNIHVKVFNKHTKHIVHARKQKKNTHTLTPTHIRFGSLINHSFD